VKITYLETPALDAKTCTVWFESTGVVVKRNFAMLVPEGTVI
jgi:hypothetical protein